MPPVFTKDVELELTLVSVEAATTCKTLPPATAPNSKAFPAALTFTACPAEPKDKPAFHIPPEPAANCDQ